MRQSCVYLIYNITLRARYPRKNPLPHNTTGDFLHCSESAGKERRIKTGILIETPADAGGCWLSAVSLAEWPVTGARSVSMKLRCLPFPNVFCNGSSMAIVYRKYMYKLLSAFEPFAKLLTRFFHLAACHNMLWRCPQSSARPCGRCYAGHRFPPAWGHNRSA